MCVCGDVGGNINNPNVCLEQKCLHSSCNSKRRGEREELHILTFCCRNIPPISDKYYDALLTWRILGSISVLLILKSTQADEGIFVHRVRYNVIVSTRNWDKGPFTLSFSINATMWLVMLLWLNCLNSIINQASHYKKSGCNPHCSDMTLVLVLTLQINHWRLV